MAQAAYARPPLWRAGPLEDGDEAAWSSRWVPKPARLCLAQLARPVHRGGGHSVSASHLGQPQDPRP